MSEIVPRNSRLIVALFCLCAALFIRLYGISDPAPQPDERNWLSRSHKVLFKFKTELLDSTSHLGHPGLPPTMIMVAAQVVAHEFNSIFNLESGSKYYLDDLTASRMALATTSALIVPIFVWFAAPLLGLTWAALAALLLAFDPVLTGCARMAHIDATLTLLVTLTVLSYLYALKSGKLSWKIIAGVFWGLSILVKPTPIALIPALFIYKFLYLRKSEQPKEPLFAWSDVAVLLTGQLVMILLWTRYWYHYSAFKYQLHVRSVLATNFYNWGVGLQQHLALILIAVALLLALFLYMKRAGGWRYHAAILALLLAGFLITATFIPQVYENLIRYWTWVLGLSGIKHESFGYSIDRHEWGYLDVLVSHFNLVLLAGLLLGIFFTLKMFITRSNKNRDLYFLCLVISLIWIVLLNVSSKQTWRYALPVSPFIYLIIAVGFSSLFVKGSRINRVQLPFVVLVVASQLYSSLSFYPYYEMYFNDLTGGVNGALRRDYSIPLTGQNEVIDHLVERLGDNKDSVLISTFGDETTLEYTAARRHPDKHKLLNFGYFRPETADYLLKFKTIRNDPGSEWSSTTSKTPIFTFNAQGLELLSLYKVPLQKLDGIYSFDLNNGGRNTGKLINESGQYMLEALAGADSKGFLFYSHGIRIPAGSYKITFELMNLSPNALKTLLAAKIQFGTRCDKQLAVADLKPSIPTKFELECNYDKENRISPRVYWNGNVALRILGISIR